MIIQAKTNKGLNEKLSVLTHFIGNTPLFPLHRVFKKKGVELYAKLEWQQLSGSVKARAAFSIIREAVENNQLDQNRRLLDATSGNTGIAYAHIAAALGIPLTIVLPENASAERKQILSALGAELIYTSKFGGTDEAQDKAAALAQQNPDLYYYADQYANLTNWKAHVTGTAKEIWEQTENRVTHFVAGLGTTGTFVGTTKGLKNYNQQIQTIALQPETALHGLEGWKDLETAKVPKIYDATTADEFLTVSTLEAYDYVKRLAKEEGLLVSPSAAANLVGAIKVAERLESGVVVTIFPDDASKYSEVTKQIFKAYSKPKTAKS